MDLAVDFLSEALDVVVVLLLLLTGGSRASSVRGCVVDQRDALELAAKREQAQREVPRVKDQHVVPLGVVRARARADARAQELVPQLQRVRHRWVLRH